MPQSTRRFALRLLLTGAVTSFAGLACDDPLALLEPPEPPAQLTLLSVLDPNQPFQTVRITPVDLERTLSGLTARLYEDGVLVATAVPADETTGARCGPDAFHSFMVPLECLVFPYWVRHGHTYRVEVEADGFARTWGETSTPGPFVTSTVSIQESGGQTRFDLAWTPSSGAFIYWAAARLDEERSSCGQLCDPSLYLETDQTSAAGEAPPCQGGGGCTWIVDVVAADRHLHEYLNTGAEGETFTVPPIQNVVGGHGVIGSWVRRTYREGTPEPVIEQGDWESVANIPGYGITVAASGAQVIASPEGLYVDAGNGWQRIAEGRARVAWSAGPHTWAMVESTVYRSGADPVAWEPVAELVELAGAAVLADGEGLVLVAAPVEAGQAPGLYRSTNDGDSFELRRLPLDGDRNAAIVALARDPRDGTLYAAARSQTWSDGQPSPVLRSEDDGLTWQPVEGTLETEVWELAVGAGGRLLAGTRLIHPAPFWVSENGGGSWTRVAELWTDAILPHPTDPDRVWVIESREGAPEADWGGAYYSEDGGLTFRPYGLGHTDLRSGALDVDRGFVYVNQEGIGFLRRPIRP